MSQFSQVDTCIGNRTLGINLIASPPRSVREYLSTIQDEIESRIPEGVLFRCPCASLHLSIFQFVWARAGVREMKEAGSWIYCRERVVSELATIADSTPQFLLGSPSIHPGRGATIIRFSQSDTLEQLRDRVSAVADEAGLSWNRPTIQHVSIFRYRRSIALDKLVAACASIQMPFFTWPVRRMSLMREHAYPSLDLSLIREYTLLD